MNNYLTWIRDFNCKHTSNRTQNKFFYASTWNLFLPIPSNCYLNYLSNKLRFPTTIQSKQMIIICITYLGHEDYSFHKLTPCGNNSIENFGTLTIFHSAILFKFSMTHFLTAKVEINTSIWNQAWLLVQWNVSCFVIRE